MSPGRSSANCTRRSPRRPSTMKCPRSMMYISSPGWPSWHTTVFARTSIQLKRAPTSSRASGERPLNTTERRSASSTIGLTLRDAMPRPLRPTARSLAEYSLTLLGRFFWLAQRDQRESPREPSLLELFRGDHQVALSQMVDHFTREEMDDEPIKLVEILTVMRTLPIVRVADVPDGEDVQAVRSEHAQDLGGEHLELRP